MNADPNILARLEAALIDQLGGAEVYAWAEAHYRKGETLTQIAAKAGVDRTTVHRRVRKMRASLASYGLLPATWRNQPTGPREKSVAKSRNNTSTETAPCVEQAA